MRERFPRALLSACTHIARVLGIHIAKRVDTRPPAAGWCGRIATSTCSAAEQGATTDEALVPSWFRSRRAGRGAARDALVAVGT